MTPSDTQYTNYWAAFTVENKRARKQCTSKHKIIITTATTSDEAVMEQIKWLLAPNIQKPLFQIVEIQVSFGRRGDGLSGYYITATLVWEEFTKLFTSFGLRLGLHRISALAPENPESCHFSKIQPSPVPAKFLARFDGCQCSCSDSVKYYPDVKNTKFNAAPQISSKSGK